MINRMIEATEGQIEIDGKDVRSMNLLNYVEILAMLFNKLA